MTNREKIEAKWNEYQAAKREFKARWQTHTIRGIADELGLSYGYVANVVYAIRTGRTDKEIKDD